MVKTEIFVFLKYCCMYPGCDNEYKTKYNLKRHILIYHLKKKRECCEICKKEFINSENIKDHYNIHNGVAPYSCTICNEKFHNRSNLSKHRKEHMRPKKLNVQV